MVILTALALPLGVRAEAPVSPQATIAALERADQPLLEGTALLSSRLLSELYAARDDQLLWGAATRRAALLELAERSVESGFDPNDFRADTLRILADSDHWATLAPSERVRADLVLSDALLRYVHHHRYGKVDPVRLDRAWHDRPRPDSEVLRADLDAALDARDLTRVFEGRFPAPFWYEDLKSALRTERVRETMRERPPVPAGPHLARGDQGPRVAMVRERLALLAGQSAEAAPAGEVFDDALHAAVIAFQQGSGLVADGVVGPATLAVLNKSTDPDRMDRIRINLERMRWLYQGLPPDYVFVDVAGLMVHLARSDEFVWSTRAIIGTVETQTPMFRDNMDHLVFNPTWIVPQSIQRSKTRVASDFQVVDRRTGQPAAGGDHRDVNRYRLVQRPGPNNALGRVKFMFPNRHAIYLHDTPSRALFARQRRTLSNGCVRVENPLEFAERILDRPAWDLAGIKQVIERGRTRYVELSESLPVLLYYLTAFADAQGIVQFRQDHYERDARLRAAFFAPVGPARIAFPAPREPAEPAAPADTGASTQATGVRSATDGAVQAVLDPRE
ncbi:murein L,D-transpeptidase [Thiocapsa imhoffii]|uniref:Murein L,D-transpeptidase n=1 Tax=Thiocapsa imhoffii TaxID=382777 RepID=A0A9X1B801_9GAMM|nr:L,D-transpeptidase family protein [Thiocapsa imhoffii]MBK1644359.1 murein L,D-transpeptidase [Thiocapsa imhoffii]